MRRLAVLESYGRQALKTIERGTCLVSRGGFKGCVLRAASRGESELLPPEIVAYVANCIGGTDEVKRRNE